MRTLNITAFAGAILLASGVAAYGQSASKPAKAGSVTLVGCLVSETDYRQAHGLGKGGIAGVKTGTDLVLVDASTVSSAEAGTGAASSGVAVPCTEQGAGQAYRLAGSVEGKLKGLAGHRMEISGRFEHEASPGVSAPSSDKLPPEFVVSSFRDAPVASAPEPVAAAAPSPAPSAPPNVEPPPAPPTGQVASAEPSQLPRTASPLPLIALVGLLSLGLGSFVWLVPARR